MGIDLNPSSNWISPAVIDAQGHQCDDLTEGLAVERAKQLFGADYVNVRPRSAAGANTAVYAALLEPGDTVLRVNFCHGSSLSQEEAAISGMNLHFADYRFEGDSGRINYENVFGLAFKYKPKLITAGTGYYPRKTDFVQLQEVAEEVGARLLVDMSHIAGLVAAGLHQNPVPYADFVTATTAETLKGPQGGMVMCRGKYAGVIDKAVSRGIQSSQLEPGIAAMAAALREALSPEFKVYQEQTVKNARALAAELTRCNFNLVSGGTDNHVILVDLGNKGITGAEAERLLAEAGLTGTREYIPCSNQDAGIARGLGIGTPAVTVRGMKEDAMAEIAEIINIVISHPIDKTFLANAGRMAADLCSRYPLG